jgi:prevent-host-death family protein
LTIKNKVDTFQQRVYLEELIMGTITAKQLKQKTGEVIRRIKSGERLTLTYRGKPLAIIEPTPKNDIKELNRVSESVKAWEKIESTLNRTNSEFKNWREATEWVRNRI